MEEDDEFEDDEKFEKFWQAAHPVFVVATICYCVHIYHVLFMYFDFTKQESLLGLYITNIRYLLLRLHESFNMNHIT